MKEVKKTVAAKSEEVKAAAEKKAETAEAQKQKALDELRRIGVSEERIAEIMNS